MSKEDLSFLFLLLFFLLNESFRPWRNGQRKLRRGVATDIAYTIINNFLVWRAVHLIASVLEIPSQASWMVFDFSITGIFIGVPFLVLYQDFQMYWIHRALHRVPFLWKLHKVHHSALDIDVLNASRTHILESILYSTLMYIPMGLLGFSPNVWFLAYLMSNFFSLYTHANSKVHIGKLGFVLNSPQFHLWHHHREERLNHGCNFGNALSLWDYLFGTAYFPSEEKDIPLGFDGVDDYPQGFFSQLAAPFYCENLGNEEYRVE